MGLGGLGAIAGGVASGYEQGLNIRAAKEEREAARERREWEREERESQKRIGSAIGKAYERHAGAESATPAAPGGLASKPEPGKPIEILISTRGRPRPFDMYKDVMNELSAGGHYRDAAKFALSPEGKRLNDMAYEDVRKKALPLVAAFIDKNDANAAVRLYNDFIPDGRKWKKATFSEDGTKITATMDDGKTKEFDSDTMKKAVLMLAQGPNNYYELQLTQLRALEIERAKAAEENRKSDRVLQRSLSLADYKNQQSGARAEEKYARDQGAKDASANPNAFRKSVADLMKPDAMGRRMSYKDAVKQAMQVSGGVPLDVFLDDARKANPGASDEALTELWKQKYGR